MLPSLPPPTGLHPLVIHFPVALLLVAPLLILLSLVMKRQRVGLGAAALVLMVLGTAAAFVAVYTGNLAGELAERTPQVSATLERHEELAETSRTVFALLTGMFAVMFGAPLVRRREWSNGLYVGVVAGVPGLLRGRHAHVGQRRAPRWSVGASIRSARDAGAGRRRGHRDSGLQRPR